MVAGDKAVKLFRGGGTPIRKGNRLGEMKGEGTREAGPEKEAGKQEKELYMPFEKSIEHDPGVPSLRLHGENLPGCVFCLDGRGADRGDFNRLLRGNR